MLVCVCALHVTINLKWSLNYISSEKSKVIIWKLFKAIHKNQIIQGSQASLHFIRNENVWACMSECKTEWSVNEKQVWNVSTIQVV